MVHDPVNTHIDWMHDERNCSKTDDGWTPLKNSFVILKGFLLFKLLITSLDEPGNNITWDQDRCETLENKSISKGLENS